MVTTRNADGTYQHTLTYQVLTFPFSHRLSRVRPAIACFTLLLLTACQKDAPVAPATKTVAYELSCSPLVGASLTGAVTYTDRSRGTSTGTLVNNRWAFEQGGWTLTKGERLSAQATVQGNSDCRLSIAIDGGVTTFERQSVQISGQTPTNTLRVEYVAP